MTTIAIPLAFAPADVKIEPVDWDPTLLRITLPPAALGTVVLPRSLFSDEINAKTQWSFSPETEERLRETKQSRWAIGSPGEILKEFMDKARKE
jgi:hypothetical protein